MILDEPRIEMILDEPRIEMILDEPRIERHNCLWLGAGINLWECLCLTVNSSYLLIRVASSIQLFTLRTILRRFVKSVGQGFFTWLKMGRCSKSLKQKWFKNSYTKGDLQIIKMGI